MASFTSLVGSGLLLLSAYVGYRGLRWVGRYNRIVRTASAAVGDVTSPGTVKVAGTVGADATFESPIQRRRCLFAAWEVEEWDQSGKSNKWETVAKGGYAMPFEVDDGTGRIEVDLRERSFDGNRVSTYDDWLDEAGDVDADVYWNFGKLRTVAEHPPGEMPRHLQRLTNVENIRTPSGAMVESVDFGTQHETRRYSEWTLGAGDDVFVVGEAHADPDASRPLGPGDLTIRPPADGELIVSNRSEATVKRRIRILMLQFPAAVLMAMVGAVLVFGLPRWLVAVS